MHPETRASVRRMRHWQPSLCTAELVRDEYHSLLYGGGLHRERCCQFADTLTVASLKHLLEGLQHIDSLAVATLAAGWSAASSVLKVAAACE